MVQLDRDVAGMLHDQVRHVGEVDGLAGEVATAEAQVDLGVGENLRRIANFELELELKVGNLVYGKN